MTNNSWVDRWVAEHYAALLDQETVGLTIESNPVRLRVVTSALGLSYYELPDGRRFPVPIQPEARWYFPETEDGRAEEMSTQRREVVVPVSDLIQRAIARSPDGQMTYTSAGSVAREVLARHLGPEAVEDLEEEDISVRVESQDGQVVRVFETPDGESVTQPIYGIGFSDPSDDPEVSPFTRHRSEHMRDYRDAQAFDHIVRTQDPALSAWNPVTGLEPVLCRVCGQSSDPRRGKILEHRSGYPCAPVTERATPEGATSRVLDLVLLASANMREDPAAERTELTPWEVLEISVRAYRDAGMKGTNLARGDVRECQYCLALSPRPGWPIQHDDSHCSANHGYVVCRLDPEETMVAARHIPGARYMSDPDWHLLGGGWWVALEGTEGPGEAETYVDSIPLADVAEKALAPTDTTPVRLTAEDRAQSRGVAETLSRMTQYFQALDRPETLHGIVALTQAITTAVEQCWTALEGFHDEDHGGLLHAALGTGETCPVCEGRDFAGQAPEWMMQNLAQAIHLALSRESGTVVHIRVVQVILNHLTYHRRRGEDFSDVYRVASKIRAAVNRGILWSHDPRDRGHREVTIVDISRVATAYARYIAEGGPL
jgi:hypothetical protein